MLASVFSFCKSFIFGISGLWDAEAVPRDIAQRSSNPPVDLLWVCAEAVVGRRADGVTYTLEVVGFLESRPGGGVGDSIPPSPKLALLVTVGWEEELVDV
jgi:hypothetical protein